MKRISLLTFVLAFAVSIPAANAKQRNPQPKDFIVPPVCLACIPPPPHTR